MNDIILGNQGVISSDGATISIVSTGGTDDFSASSNHISSLKNHGEHWAGGGPLDDPWEEVFTLMLLIMLFKLLLAWLAQFHGH